MKSWLTVLLLSVTFASRLAAQPTKVDASTSSATTPYNTPQPVFSEPQPGRDDVLAVKKFKVTGFLARPFKAIRLRKAGSAVTGLFQAINPFARQKKPAADARFEGELSTIAWSSSVSWNTGFSKMANPVTQETGVPLLTVSR